MKKLIKQAALVGAALALVSGSSVAKDPLLGGSSGAVVVADKDLENVRGSGSTAALYGYYGSYYASQAQYYGRSAITTIILGTPGRAAPLPVISTMPNITHIIHIIITTTLMSRLIETRKLVTALVVARAHRIGCFTVLTGRSICLTADRASPL